MDRAPEPPNVILPLVLAALLVGALVGGILLIVALAPPGPQLDQDLNQGTWQQAQALGITLPEGASRVFVQGRQDETASSRYLRFDLPRQAFLRYHLALSRRPGARMEADLPIPAHWPGPRELHARGFEAPAFFEEHERLRPRIVVVIEQAADASVRGAPSGRSNGQYWVLDMERYRVFVWLWTWQGWALPPAPAPTQAP